MVYVGLCVNIRIVFCSSLPHDDESVTSIHYTILCSNGIHTLNMRSLTLAWWFTSASLLRRNSTIWFRPFLQAIKNAVWPSCKCKSEQVMNTIPPTSLHSATLQPHTNMTIVKPRQFMFNISYFQSQVNTRLIWCVHNTKEILTYMCVEWPKMWFHTTTVYNLVSFCV